MAPAAGEGRTKMVPVFWISLLGLVYIYAGYPALVWFLARICPRPIDGTRDPGGPLAVILVAHNEAEVLAEKIESVLASTLADRIVEIVVASDASTDATQEVVAHLSDPRIRCMAFAERRGKAACLNDAVGSSKAPILILTDARQWVAPDALEKLVCCLGDASVGVASGELVFRRPSSPGATGQGMGVYWRYERFIRLQESLVGSVPGATGALYALRREQFRKLPEDLILDDVFLPMRVIEQGYRCVLTPGAFVYDRVSETSREEWARKRRTQAGCVQLIQRYPRWLLRGAFFSHKAARLLSPLAADWIPRQFMVGMPLGVLDPGPALCGGRPLPNTSRPRGTPAAGGPRYPFCGNERGCTCGALGRAERPLYPGMEKRMSAGWHRAPDAGNGADGVPAYYGVHRTQWVDSGRARSRPRGIRAPQATHWPK